MAESDSTASNKRARVDSDESTSESPERKRIRENLLDILDDEEGSEVTQDLALFMKSFEEEISGQSSPDSLPPPSQASASASELGESQPDLGFLLGASDDELGLPPTSSGENENENERRGEDILSGAPEAVGFDQMWGGFDDEIPCYDALVGYGIRAEEKNEEEAVVFGGLFDFSDAGSGSSSDFSDFQWRPESLPAL